MGVTFILTLGDIAAGYWQLSQLLVDFSTGHADGSNQKQLF